MLPPSHPSDETAVRVEGTIWEPRGALGMDFRKLIPSTHSSAVGDNHPQLMEVTCLSEFKMS